MGEMEDVLTIFSFGEIGLKATTGMVTVSVPMVRIKVLIYHYGLVKDGHFTSTTIGELRDLIDHWI